MSGGRLKRYSERMAFAGMKVLAFETRRANEMAELIRRQGGEPVVVPSMREVPLESNREAFKFAEKLFGGEFDLVVFLTGVGTRALNKVLASRYPEERFAAALREITVVARGPKPASALREMGVPPNIIVPEPNTWRELLTALDGRRERRIAVQEYGNTNMALLDGLRDRGAHVTAVRVYQYDMPEDTDPLRDAAKRLAAGQFDVALFTTSMQAVHLFRIARESGLEDQVRAAFGRMVIASIGPTTTETLEDLDLHPDMTPTHPKMGVLVQECAADAPDILKRKRT